MHSAGLAFGIARGANKTCTHRATVEMSPYNGHQIEAFSFFFSIVLVRTILCACLFGVLAAFYKFHCSCKVHVCATLIMGNRFLGVQISIIWVVVAFKTGTLMWQPAQERITDGHLLGIMRKRWKYTTQSDVIIPH